MKGINTEELYEILDSTLSWQNIMLAGKHGIGKSQILTDYFPESDLTLIPAFLLALQKNLPEKTKKVRPACPLL